ncbi:MAG TPA: (2Fe-2S)-binding protein [Cyanobacteria bacterium UBA8530]|nr:(2Fe-2S)-binding protein [Cyanobacteria bacterium UBA8530]
MDNKIICRCEDLTEEEIRQEIRQGARTLDELKRLTRTGMGPCQGKTCRPMIMRILAEETGVRLEDMVTPTVRQPLVPITLGDLAHEEN